MALRQNICCCSFLTISPKNTHWKKKALYSKISLDGTARLQVQDLESWKTIQPSGQSIDDIYLNCYQKVAAKAAASIM